MRPNPAERDEIHHLIMNELIHGIFKPDTVARFHLFIGRMKEEGCDPPLMTMDRLGRPHRAGAETENAPQRLRLTLWLTVDRLRIIESRSDRVPTRRPGAFRKRWASRPPRRPFDSAIRNCPVGMLAAFQTTSHMCPFGSRKYPAARLPPDRHPEHGARRHSRTRRDEIERPQDAQRVRSP
jgi:hypothetical protein